MERRRTRLEILAQVTAHDYGLSLRYGTDADKDANAVRIEDPELTLGRLGGELNDDHILRYQKGMTLTEVGHRREGSLKWAFQAAAAERKRPGFFPLWHTLEDARCENRLAEDLPGTRKNFRAFIRPALAMAEQLHARGELPLYAQIRWAAYLTGVGLAPGAPADGPGALRTAWFDPPVCALIEEIGDAIDRACGSATGETCFLATGEIYETIRHLLTEEELAQARDSVRMPELAEETVENPELGQESEAGELQEEMPRAEGESGVEPEGEFFELSPEEMEKLGHWASPWFENQGNKKEVHPRADLPDERTIVIPLEGKSEEYRAIVDGASSHIKVLATKLLQIIQERTYTRYSGAHRSGKLNTSKLWKQRLGKYRLFHRREEPERLDVCFTLLVDESGSMNRESKYLAAREATIFFAEVLDRIGVPFEIIGYSTESSEAAMAAALGHVPAFKYRHIRHSPLQHRVYKGFDDPFGRIKNRLVNIYPRFNNWDEEHLLFAYRRLRNRSEKEKIVIITSDGQPNGDASHLVRTVERLEKLGIRIVGLGVVDPFVEQIYPNHIIVNDLSQLTEELVGILRQELLKGSAAAVIR